MVLFSAIPPSLWRTMRNLIWRTENISYWSSGATPYSMASKLIPGVRKLGGRNDRSKVNQGLCAFWLLQLAAVVGIEAGVGVARSRHWPRYGSIDLLIRLTMAT